MGSRRPFLTAAFLGIGLLAIVLAVAGPLGAAPDEKKSGGSTYRNKELGVVAQGPAGWKMVADKVRRASSWQRLVSFDDTATDAQATLSARSRTAVRLDDLMSDVRAAVDASVPKLNVSSMRKIEANALNPIGTVIMDATYVRKPEVPKPKPGEPPPPPMPPITYRVQATYYLGPDYEYQLYATAQQTHWSRIRAALEELRGSVKMEADKSGGPQGAGSYRDDLRGFTCKFPVGYTVVVPQRENHIVQFQGVGAKAPVLSVYTFPWEESVERDAERLIQYYEEDLGGNASLRREDIAGREAVVVIARASANDKKRTVMIALFKRGNEIFRLRASMPQAVESKGEAVFKRFVGGFRLRAAPK